MSSSLTASIFDTLPQTQPLLTGNREDYRFLHRLWVSLVQWDVMPNHHSGILTASRQISAQEWSDAVARLLNDVPNIQGALYTFVTPPGTWHRDRF